MTNKTHWRRHDFRRDSLETIISGLQSALEQIQNKVKTLDWYDGQWALEESEPVIGMAFIAAQNYVNKSIADYNTAFKLSINKDRYYHKSAILTPYGSTAIELIIALANYAKHEEEQLLRKHTKLILDSFGFKQYDINIEESPIIKGLELLTKDWNLVELSEMIMKWRNELWFSGSDSL